MAAQLCNVEAGSDAIEEFKVTPLAFDGFRVLQLLRE